MRLLAHYWWVLPIFIIVPLVVWQWLHMPRAKVVLLLRIAGAALLVASGIWLITGNVETSTVSIHLTGGQAALSAGAGLVGLTCAQYLARKRKPAA